jgi:hypothetical protein
MSTDIEIRCLNCKAAASGDDNFVLSEADSLQVMAATKEGWSQGLEDEDLSAAVLGWAEKTRKEANVLEQVLEGELIPIGRCAACGAIAFVPIDKVSEEEYEEK